MNYAVHIKGPDKIRSILVDVEGKPNTSAGDAFIHLGDSWFRREDVAAIVTDEDCSENLGSMYD